MTKPDVEIDSFDGFRLTRRASDFAYEDEGLTLYFEGKVLATSGCGCCGFNIYPEEVRAMFAALRARAKGER